MSLSCTAQGFYWVGAGWQTSPYTQVGRSDRTHFYMTRIDLVTDKPVKDIVISFQASRSGVLTRWGLTEPTEGPSTESENTLTTAQSNSLILGGVFSGTVSVYIWSNITNYWVSELRQFSAEAGEAGLAHIEENNAYADYIPYIEDGSDYEMYIPYVDTGEEWEVLV